MFFYSPSTIRKMKKYRNEYFQKHKLGPKNKQKYVLRKHEPGAPVYKKHKNSAIGPIIHDNYEKKDYHERSHEEGSDGTPHEKSTKQNHREPHYGKLIYKSSQGGAEAQKHKNPGYNKEHVVKKYKRLNQGKKNPHHLEHKEKENHTKYEHENLNYNKVKHSGPHYKETKIHKKENYDKPEHNQPKYDKSNHPAEIFRRHKHKEGNNDIKHHKYKVEYKNKQDKQGLQNKESKYKRPANFKPNYHKINNERPIHHKKPKLNKSQHEHPSQKEIHNHHEYDKKQSYKRPVLSKPKLIKNKHTRNEGKKSNNHKPIKLKNINYKKLEYKKAKYDRTKQNDDKGHKESNEIIPYNFKPHYESIDHATKKPIPDFDSFDLNPSKEFYHETQKTKGKKLNDDENGKKNDEKKKNPGKKGKKYKKPKPTKLYHKEINQPLKNYDQDRRIHNQHSSGNAEKPEEKGTIIKNNKEKNQIHEYKLSEGGHKSDVEGHVGILSNDVTIKEYTD